MKPLTNLSQKSMIDLTEVQPKAQFSRNVPTRDQNRKYGPNCQHCLWRLKVLKNHEKRSNTYVTNDQYVYVKADTYFETHMS